MLFFKKYDLGSIFVEFFYPENGCGKTQYMVFFDKKERGCHNMQKKILIVDSSYEYRRALAAALANRPHVLICEDGVEALTQLHEFRPDYLVLDLMIPGIGGISLLKKAQEEGILPPTLVTSNFYGQPMTAALERLGIGYAISKPCCPSAIVSALEDLMASTPGKTIRLPTAEGIVGGVLMDLGFCVSHSGYRYCRDAIVMLLADSTLRVTKDIYVPIAKQANCQQGSVEKCIRDAIHIAWNVGDKRVWARYFPGPGGRPYKPSNRVFLCAIAEHLTHSPAFAAENRRKTAL